MRRFPIPNFFPPVDTLLAVFILVHMIACSTVSNDVGRIPEETLASSIVKTDLVVTPEEPSDSTIADEEPFEKGVSFAEYAKKDEVKKWLRYFQNRGRGHFATYLNRGRQYGALIKTLLRKQEVPTYLLYLALIESGFSVSAHSQAQAIGIWQFITPTARRYGLRINEYVDERRDPIRSTIAAARFLNDLKNVFNSWPLAMAAYNAGEARIMGAIMRHGTRDYWELSEKRALPTETREYVPKFIAAAMIASQPEAYGFGDVSGEALPSVVSAIVPSPVRLDDIARVTKVSVATIRSLNPHLKGEITPPSLPNYRIWLPKETNIAANSSLAALQPIHHPSLPATQDEYRVRRGDNLRKIAARFHVSVHNLRQWNDLRSHHLLVGSILKLKQSDSAVQNYRVRRGDSLQSVARRFNTTPGEIRRLNDLKRSKIYAGQVLKIESDRG